MLDPRWCAPLLDRKLGGNERRPVLIAIIEDLDGFASARVLERSDQPVGEHYELAAVKGVVPFSVGTEFPVAPCFMTIPPSPGRVFRERLATSRVA